VLNLVKQDRSYGGVDLGVASGKKCGGLQQLALDNTFDHCGALPHSLAAAKSGEETIDDPASTPKYGKDDGSRPTTLH